MKKQVTMTAMMIAWLLSLPTEALCQTTVTAGKDVKSIGVTEATEGAQETVTEIDEEGQEVTADEGSTVRVTGNAPEEGKVARLKLTVSKEPEIEVVKVKSIVVKGNKSVIVGKSIKMKSKIKPADADNKDVTWSVQDYDKNTKKTLATSKRASISRSGKLKGRKNGYVIVTATAQDGSNVTGTMIVHVKKKASTNSGFAGFSIDEDEPYEPDEDEWTDLSIVADTEGTEALKNEIKKTEGSIDALSILPEDVKAEIGEEYTKVNETVTVKINTGMVSYKFRKRFQTTFEEEDIVMCLFAIPGANGKIEWILVTGEADEDGDICMTLTEAEYDKLAGKEVVLVIVNK